MKNFTLILFVFVNFYFTKLSFAQPTTYTYEWINLGSGISETPRQIWGIHAVDENIIWAITAFNNTNLEPVFEFTRTIDGGATWQPGLLDIEPQFSHFDIFALDDQIAWITAADELDPISGKVYRTIDGGNTWVKQSSGFTGFNETPAGIHFWNANEGMSFGATCATNNTDQIAIYTTIDGGDEWTKVSGSNMPAQLPGEGICLVSGNGIYDVIGDTIWFVSSFNRVFKSIDRGLSWTVSDQLFPNEYAQSLAFKDAFNGILVGSDPNYDYNVAARTSDGGETWTPITILDETNAGQIEYVPGTPGTYMIHSAFTFKRNNKMMVTTDSGNTWEVFDNNFNLICLEVLSEEIGFGGAEIISSDSGGIYKMDKIIVTVPSIIYVNKAATGNNDGTSWADAFVELEDALATAIAGDTVWVAKGTYTPDVPNGDTTATFLIDKDILLLGGFVGTETNASQRDPAINVTVVSGDLNGDDVVNDFVVNRSDNVLTVVTITTNITDVSIIDGFTISNGHADGTGGNGLLANGGGMRSRGYPVIKNCIFTQNFAVNLGGGVACIPNSEGTAIFENCTFDWNLSNRGGGAYMLFSDAIFTDCHFSNNHAIATVGQPFEEAGGGIYTRNSNCQIKRCTFNDNTCMGGGCGMFYWIDFDGIGFSLTVDSCTFNENVALTNMSSASALYTQSFGKDSDVKLTNSAFTANQTSLGTVIISHQTDGAYGKALVDNCLFEGNTSSVYSGAMDIGQGPGTAPSEYTITNCTFMENTAGVSGGALGLWCEEGTEGKFYIENCHFEKNKVDVEGGAIWGNIASDGFDGHFRYCTFLENESPSGSVLTCNPTFLFIPGVAKTASLTMDNCILSSNTGNAISATDFSTINLINNTIADNTDTTLLLHDQSGLTLQNNILYNPGYVEFATISNNFSLVSHGGNLLSDNTLDGLHVSDFKDANPEFVGTGDLCEQYELPEGSPAIDAGTPVNNPPDYDICGNERVVGGINSGAIEIEPEKIVSVKEVISGILDISPNPTTNYINIQLPASIQGFANVNIYDAHGRFIYEQSITGNQKINLQEFEPGIHLVKLIAGEQVYTGKFLKH